MWPKLNKSVHTHTQSDERNLTLVKQQMLSSLENLKCDLSSYFDTMLQAQFLALLCAISCNVVNCQACDEDILIRCKFLCMSVCGCFFLFIFVAASCIYHFRGSLISSSYSYLSYSSRWILMLVAFSKINIFPLFN